MTGSWKYSNQEREKIMPANLTLSIETNAGGVAKSTISYNLAYELGVRGYSVALLDIEGASQFFAKKAKISQDR
ncbi:MAG: hypothetical protein V7K71_07035 [Nostoc sp.]|uniref:nucleotide-binding protein n=1 Tax=Nostoc sp. TaxID=1180 RepID=UPI002FF57784